MKNNNNKILAFLLTTSCLCAPALWSPAHATVVLADTAGSYTNTTTYSSTDAGSYVLSIGSVGADFINAASITQLSTSFGSSAFAVTTALGGSFTNSSAITSNATYGTAVSASIVTIGGSVTNTASGVIAGYTGLSLYRVLGDVVNNGAINATSAGISMSGAVSGSVINTGTITALSGTGISSFSTVGSFNNSGTINAGTAVSLSTVTHDVENTGTLNGSGSYGYGFYANSVGGNFANSGQILSSSTNGMEAVSITTLTGSFSNTGTISSVTASRAAVSFNGVGGSVSNQGTISASGNYSKGVSISTLSGSFSNTGTISQTGNYGDGVSVSSMTGSFANTGNITASGEGSKGVSITTLDGLFQNDGSIVNSGSAVSGSGAGVDISSLNNSFVNNGTISGQRYGVSLTFVTGSIINTGSISGVGTGLVGGTGLDAVFVDGSFLNTGTISSSIPSGTALSITNLAGDFVNSGTIVDRDTTGTGSGLYIGSIGGSFVNTGTISGAAYLGTAGLTITGGDSYYGVWTNGTLTTSGDISFAKKTYLNDDINASTNTVTFLNDSTTSLSRALSITGNVSLASGSSLISLVTSTSLYGSLNLAGSGSMAANGSILLQKASGSSVSWAPGQTYQVVSNATSVDLSGLSAKAVGYAGYSTLSTTSNGDGTKNIVVQLTAAAAPSLQAAVLGQGLMASPVQSLIGERAEGSMDPEFTQHHHGLWLQSVNEWTDKAVDGNFAGYHANIYGVVMGGDLPVIGGEHSRSVYDMVTNDGHVDTNDLYLGGSLAYLTSKTTSKGLTIPETLYINSYQLSAYAFGHRGPWFMDAELGAGLNDFKDVRVVSDVNVKGIGLASQYALRVNAGYTLPALNGMLTPMVGGRILDAEVYPFKLDDGYTKVSGQSMQYYQIETGVRMAWAFPVWIGDDRDTEFMLHPAVKLTHVHDWSPDPMTTTTTTGAGAVQSRIPSDGARIDLSVGGFKLGRTTDFEVEYRADLRRRYSDQMLVLKGSLHF